MATRATVLYDAPGLKIQCFDRTLTWIVAAAAVAILAWMRVKLANKGQFESNKWSSFLGSTTWTTYILPGLINTIIAAVVSVVLALVIGALLGVGRLDPIAPVRWLRLVIIEFFRAVPVLVLILFAYLVFAIWQLFPSNYLDFAVVVFDLTMYSGSVIGETLRSGIESLSKGQQEATIASDLSRRQTMVTILLPQTVTAVLPAIISQMIIALKDSALDYMIDCIKVIRSGRQFGRCYGAMIPSLVVVAIILIAISFGLANLVKHVEGQLHAGHVRRSIIAKVPHQRDMGVTTEDGTSVDWHAEGRRDLRGTHK